MYFGPSTDGDFMKLGLHAANFTGGWSALGIGGSLGLDFGAVDVCCFF